MIRLLQEPQPEPVGDWETVIGKRPLNKFIFMAEPERINEIRPLVQRSVGQSGHLTQAQSNMLEVLPLGSSKGYGVKRLLEAEKVNARNVLAIGDAENVSFELCRGGMGICFLCLGALPLM